MSEETKLTHASQVLLEASELAFNEDNRERGIDLIKDCLVLLGNGYERLTTKTEGPTESAADTPAAEQPDESANAPKAGAIKPFKLPESKDGAGVVSEPDKQESKPDAGVVSEPDKSQNKEGSGIV